METKRNYGIDLLRVLCIFGVVVLHILGHGRVLETAQTQNGFSVSWLLEIIAYPAVNCFVLISGFVGYRAEKYYPKLSNIFSLFITVLFYNIVICYALKHFFPLAISPKDTLNAFFPISTTQYWFFTSYFAMFLISPALNLFVHRARGKMLFVFVVAFIVFCVSSLKADPFILNRGYSFVWLSLIYVLGAIIKKYDIKSKISVIGSLALVFIPTLITWLTKVLIHFFALSLIKYENIFISYCSPTVVTSAVGLFCLFAKLNISKCRKLISFFASSAFSVYLIHDNLNFSKLLIEGRFAFINDYRALLIPVFVLAFALAIFVLCTLVDKVRILLFNACCVKMLCEKLEKIIKIIVSFVYKKVRCI